MSIYHEFTPDQQVRFIIDALEDVKGLDIQVFDTTGLSNLFDRLVIASGTSNRHTKSMIRSAVNAVREQQIDIIALEGEETGEWVLLDIGDVVLHCMIGPIRDYYNLEGIWGSKPLEVELLPLSKTKPQETGFIDLGV